MVVGVEDGPRWVAGGQVSDVSRTINVVEGATIDDGVGRLGIITLALELVPVSQKAPQRMQIPNVRGANQEISR